MIKITNQQEWADAIIKAADLLAACNEFHLAENAKDGNFAKFSNMKELVAIIAENADACGLFEIVAERMQERSQDYTVN